MKKRYIVRKVSRKDEQIVLGMYKTKKEAMNKFNNTKTTLPCYVFDLKDLYTIERRNWI